MEIEESPYFIKLAPGLSLLRQRSDLVLPSKEQQTLGGKAGVQRTHISAVYSPRRKSKPFPLKMKWDSRRPGAARCPMGGTILFQLVAQPKALTAAKISLMRRQSKGREEIPSTEDVHCPWKWKTLFLVLPMSQSHILSSCEDCSVL